MRCRPWMAAEERSYEGRWLRALRPADETMISLSYSAEINFTRWWRPAASPGGGTAWFSEGGRRGRVGAVSWAWQARCKWRQTAQRGNGDPKRRTGCGTAHHSGRGGAGAPRTQACPPGACSMLLWPAAPPVGTGPRRPHPFSWHQRWSAAPRRPTQPAPAGRHEPVDPGHLAGRHYPRSRLRVGGTRWMLCSEFLHWFQAGSAWFGGMLGWSLMLMWMRTRTAKFRAAGCRR